MVASGRFLSAMPSPSHPTTPLPRFGIQSMQSTLTTPCDLTNLPHLLSLILLQILGRARKCRKSAQRRPHRQMLVLDRCCARLSCWNGGPCAGGARCSWRCPSKAPTPLLARPTVGEHLFASAYGAPHWSTAHACRTQCGFVRFDDVRTLRHSRIAETQLCPFWVLREVLKRCHGADSCASMSDRHQKPVRPDASSASCPSSGGALSRTTTFGNDSSESHCRRLPSAALTHSERVRDRASATASGTVGQRL